MGGVGMPAALWLNEFGALVMDAFDTCPYQVGSSLSGTTWRDVDVRVILSDEHWSAFGFGEPGHEMRNGKWCALVLAFSALGRQMTGLPIDFQIQQQTDANKKYDGGRSALGFTSARMATTERDAAEK